MNSVKNKKITKVYSVALSIVLFIFTCIFIMLFMLRTGNAAFIIRNTDMTNIIAVIDETEYSYYILGTLEGYPLAQNDFSLHDVGIFVRSDAAAAEIGKVVQKFTGAFIRGDLDYYLSTREIFEHLQNVEPHLSEFLGHEMTREDHIHLARMIDDIMDFSSLTVEDIIYDYDINTTFPFLWFSRILLIGAGLLCIGAMFALYWFNREQIASILLLTGIPITITGLAYIALWIAMAYHPGLFGYTIHRTIQLAGGLEPLVMLHGIVVTIIGVLLTTAYIINRFTPFIPKSFCRQMPK